MIKDIQKLEILKKALLNQSQYAKIEVTAMQRDEEENDLFLELFEYACNIDYSYSNHTVKELIEFLKDDDFDSLINELGFNPDNKIELKPCPFCGSRDITIERYGNYKKSTIILCEECGCRLESNEEGRYVGEQWNTRQEATKEQASNLIDTNQDLMKLSRWLMGYVMELHDFRNKALCKEYHDDLGKMRDHIIGQFPQLQGFNQQQLFKKLGIDAKKNQEAIKRAVKYIKEEQENEK